MKILVLDFRIYSIEYEIFEMPRCGEICRGVLEHIGFEQSVLTHCYGNQTKKIAGDIYNHTEGLKFILDTLESGKYISSRDEIFAVGHRVIHGGWSFTSSVIVNNDVKKEIYNDFLIAPIHNPYNFMGIEAAEKLLPGKPNVAVFDTSFHQTMPEVAYRYALPERIFNEYKIRKYGFHGISHKYVSERTAKLLNKKSANIISLHLGAGSSICAIKKGKSIETSMGFTPIEGLVMTNRPGDIDAGVLLYLLKRGWSAEELNSCINKESGVCGISGISDGMKEVVEAAESGNEKAELALDIFVYHIRKYLGSYYFLLGGDVDAISFTGGIGDNSPFIRRRILAGYEKFGIKIDSSLNKGIIGVEGRINSSKSKIKIFVLPKNEKVVIAKETLKLITK